MRNCRPKPLSLNFYTFLIWPFLFTASYHAYAQQKDTVHKEDKKLSNVVELSTTSWLLYPAGLHMTYSRVLNKRQSINIFGGYNEFPVNINPNIASTSISHPKSNTGYSIGVAYRFYLEKENKYNAPRGVYFAPYVSYFHFNSDRGLIYTDSSFAQTAILNFQIYFLNVGGEIGYQFVIWKRFVIDAELIGPSFTYYYFQAGLNKQISGMNENETLQSIIEALKAKLPLLGNWSNSDFTNSSGSVSQRLPAFGFRYSINIGFTF